MNGLKISRKMPDSKVGLHDLMGIFCKYLVLCFSLFLPYAKFPDARRNEVVF